MKKIEIELKDKDKLEFTLKDSASKGDYICINDISNNNFDDLKNSINFHFKSEESKYIDKLRIQEQENWINKFKTSGEYLNLKQENVILKNDIDTKIKNKELEITSEFASEINNLKTEIKTLELDKNNIKENFDLKKKNEISDIQNKNKDQINEIEKEKNAIIQTHIDRINELERNRNSLNSKLLGEELEEWVDIQVVNWFNDYEDIKWQKANKIIDGNKPDFLFQLVDSNNMLIDTVVVEAKNSYTDSKKKNSEHYLKLSKDQEKNNGNYSILVTELEPEDKFSMRKVKDYENMYIVRPEFLITLLTLLRIIMIKRKDLVKDETRFREKKDIIKDFEDFKNNLLNNSLDNINKKIDEIIKESEKIIKSATNIKDFSNLILNTHINTFKNKINDFNITKITKKIEKLDNENQPEEELREKLVFRQKV